MLAEDVENSWHRKEIGDRITARMVLASFASYIVREGEIVT
jgi:hypothetical protein